VLIPQWPLTSWQGPLKPKEFDMNAITSQPTTAAQNIPMIQTGQALLSLRDSGHNLPTALGEVIDNSIEANANNVLVTLVQSEDRGKKRVHRIAICDDGGGMSSDILHHYLVLGYSSRYMHSDTIGKYGVGAKLAALNFGRRIDVWSRDEADSEWLHVHFDLDEALEAEKAGHSVTLAPPAPLEPPAEMNVSLPAGTGTVVIWSKVDRLEEGRAARDFNELRAELEKELSRMFRYFVDGGIKIRVNDSELIAHDPLLLMERSWADHILNKEIKRDDGKKGPKHYAATLIGDEIIKVGSESTRLRVTVYPPEVVRQRGKGRDNLAKLLRVPDNLGALSFVRKNREVAYSNVPRILPGGTTEMDRYIGIEVSFDPALDDYFGIRNVKRGVEPHGELREKLRDLLKRFIPSARKEIERIWGEASREEHEKSGEHSAILEAVKDIDAVMPKSRVEQQSKTKDDAGRALHELAEDAGFEKKDEQTKYADERKEFPLVLESVSFPGNMFIATTHVAGKVIIRMNTRHPFYREMWEPLKAISERDPGTVSGDEAVKAARRTIEAMTLLLLSYGKAESMHHNPVEQYSELTQFWGQFLSTLLTKVKNVL
jgi:hypothetical protein